MSQSLITDMNHMLRRYESLKRQWFSRRTVIERDEDGEEIPNCVDRSLLVQQFESLGCEIPTRPDQPFTPRAAPAPGNNNGLVYD